MKKFFLTLGVAAMTLSTFASTRILYQQNFETAADVAETGWSYGGGSISIASDNFGKYLELSLGQNNGRSGIVTWGEDIFMKDGAPVLEDGKYHLEYSFSIAQGSNNQYNGCLTVFTNHAPVTNQGYRDPWSPAGWWDNYLVDISQNNPDKMAYQYAVNGPTKETITENEDGTQTLTRSIDFADAVTFDQGAWYVVSMDVNVETREVEYSVMSLDGNEVAAGTRVVPETDVNGDPITMYAQGLYVMTARYATIIDIDDIKITYESEFEVANPPTIALTRLGQTADEELNLNMRAYTCTFVDGETLHLTGTDGQTIEVEFADCDGAYVYETTTSGILKGWTTLGDAVSEVVEVEVDCAPVVLPEATATVSSVSAGYGKTYTLTVSNAEVPLRPTIFINYKFVGVGGETIEKTGEASGCKVTVTEEGTLTITTAAFGYQSTSATVLNDTQFETKKTYDFARMTQDEISATLPGATWYVLNSNTTSGFSNWTARKRLYYLLEGSEEVNEEGATVWTNVLPFGFVSDDENSPNVINYAVLDRSAVATTANGDYFEGLTIFPDKGKLAEGALPNVGIMYHLGLYNDQTTNNNNNVIVNDLEATDFVVVNFINNYGGNSNHPICATDDQYYAQLAGEDAVYPAKENGETDADGKFVGDGTYSVTHSLYRVDTCISKITVFKQLGGGVESVSTEVIGDGYYYTIDGLRLAEPTRPGLYIHNGKKIIVK